MIQNCLEGRYQEACKSDFASLDVCSEGLACTSGLSVDENHAVERGRSALLGAAATSMTSSTLRDREALSCWSGRVAASTIESRPLPFCCRCSGTHFLLQWLMNNEKIGYRPEQRFGHAAGETPESPSAVQTGRRLSKGRTTP